MHYKIERIKFNRKDRSDDDRLGEFRITGKWFYGHSVYKNSRGVYLFCGFYGWTLNEELRKSSNDEIKRTPFRHCPAARETVWTEKGSQFVVTQS